MSRLLVSEFRVWGHSWPVFVAGLVKRKAATLIRGLRTMFSERENRRIWCGGRYKLSSDLPMLLAAGGLSRCVVVWD